MITKEQIIQKLKEIEKTHKIQILYAAESGSRAWGFDNQESDYDIRFIYKHKLNNYLTIKPTKDTIEYNDGLYDIVGWDIKKALYLHYKSNPSLREWLISNIIYIPNQYNIFEGLEGFDYTILKYHYSTMAYKNWKKFQIKKFKDFTINHAKKYAYIIRCILTWKLLDENIEPPINIFQIIKQSKINLETKENILILLKYYKSSGKTELTEDNLKFSNNWIAKSIKVMQEIKQSKINKDIKEYDKKFQEIVNHI